MFFFSNGVATASQLLCVYSNMCFGRWQSDENYVYFHSIPRVPVIPQKMPKRASRMVTPYSHLCSPYISRCPIDPSILCLRYTNSNAIRCDPPLDGDPRVMSGVAVRSDDSMCLPMTAWFCQSHINVHIC